jgi:hypothetical protein
MGKRERGERKKRRRKRSLSSFIVFFFSSTSHTHREREILTHLLSALLVTLFSVLLSTTQP